MEEQVFSTWSIVSLHSYRALWLLKKPSTVSLAQKAGLKAGRALLTGGKPAPSGFQGVFSVLLSLSMSQQSWEELNFKGRQLSPHTSRKKKTCNLFFLSKCYCPFLYALRADPLVLSEFQVSCLCLLISQ